MNSETFYLDSNSSDGEFWVNLESPTRSVKPPPISLSQLKKKPSLRPNSREKYEKTISNLRQSKEEEIKSIKIKVRNDTRKELMDSVIDMKKQVQKDAIGLQESFVNSLAIIKKKDYEILNLLKKVQKQEVLITSMRIAYEKKEENKEKVREDSIDTLKTQLEGYKIQLNLQFEINEALKNDNEYFKEQNKALISKINELKEKYEGDIDLNNDLSSTQIKRLVKEKEEIENIHKNYQSQAEKEIESRELINKRQTEMIKDLQKELKEAKEIIKSPRLQQKLIEKQKILNDKKEIIEKKRRVIYEKKIGQKGNEIDKYVTRYSFKEYKAFDTEESKISLQKMRATSISPRMGVFKPISRQLLGYLERKSFLSKKNLYNTSFNIERLALKQ